MTQSACAESLRGGRSRRLLLMTVLGEWLLVLPATVFLAAAALRLLQLRQFEPARTGWIIFEWTRAHISHLGAAAVFLGLPGVVLIVGCGTLWLEWRRNQVLRQDVAGALAILRREVGTLCLAAAVLFAGGILTFVVEHLIVG
jgi:hypothetical protein